MGLYFTEKEQEQDTEPESVSPKPLTGVKYYLNEDEERLMKTEGENEDKMGSLNQFWWIKWVPKFFAQISGHLFDTSLVRQSIENTLQSAKVFNLDSLLVPKLMQEYYYATVLRWANDDGSDVGYLQMKNIKAPATVSTLYFVDRLVQALPSSGLIVDIRDNQGFFL